MSKRNQEAIQSLETVKTFEVGKLGRKDELGTQLSFESSQKAAEKVVELFRLVPTETVSSLPERKATQLKSAANEAVRVFDEVLAFSSKQENPAEVHQRLTAEVEKLHNNTFDQLQPILTYVNAQNPSISQFEESLRRANEILAEIEQKKEESEQVLDTVRATAAETGVAQEATYFKDEANTHYGAAAIWLTLAGLTALALSLFVINQAFGLGGGDLGTFIKRLSVGVVLAAVLLFCARNYASSKHNEVVNRHRQNSLLTFNAMVDAAKTEGARDIVLQQMASAILSPQDTGYTRSKRADSSNPNTLNYPPYRIVERVIDSGTSP